MSINVDFENATPQFILLDDAKSMWPDSGQFSFKHASYKYHMENNQLEKFGIETASTRFDDLCRHCAKCCMMSCDFNNTTYVLGYSVPVVMENVIQPFYPGSGNESKIYPVFGCMNNSNCRFGGYHTLKERATILADDISSRLMEICKDVCYSEDAGYPAFVIQESIPTGKDTTAHKTLYCGSIYRSDKGAFGKSDTFKLKSTHPYYNDKSMDEFIYDCLCTTRHIMHFVVPVYCDAVWKMEELYVTEK